MKIFICNYIREYIITTNISLIHESVFLLYNTMYNENVRCNYIREYMMRNVFLITTR